MGLLDNLEQRLDRIVNGSFSKAFKSEVQPVELGGVFRIRSTAAKRPVDAIPATLVTQDATPQVPLTAFTPEATPYLTSITGEEFKITQSVTNIGRGIEADIQIDDTSVSRLHCAIVLGSDVLVRDLGSTNGLVVDGTRTTEALLRDGSIIKIGNITLTYMSK